MRCVKSRRFWAVRCVSRHPAGLRSLLSRCGLLTPRSPAQYLSLSLKYTRLTDDQLRFFPRYLVNLDLSHSSACSAHRLSKLIACCSQLQFLALNNCPARPEQLPCSLRHVQQRAPVGCSLRWLHSRECADAVRWQVLVHLELAGNMELDGNVSGARAARCGSA